MTDTSTPTEALGIRWTFRDILRGKAADILVLSVLLVVAVTTIYTYASGDEELALGTALPALLKDLITLKADVVAQNLSLTLVVLAPLLVVLWPITSLALLLFYNLRDRKLPRTPENLQLHAIEAARAWTWPYSLAIGAFDFAGMYNLLGYLLGLISEGISSQMYDLLALLVTIASLIFAERRVIRISRIKASQLPGNCLAVEGLLDGSLDCFLPHEMQSNLGRLRLATMVNLGVVRTPQNAVRLAKGLSLRTRVNNFSAFLGAAIHGVLSAATFGIASTVVNTLNDVNRRFLGGDQDILTQNLTTQRTGRLYLVVEVFSVLLSVLVATVCLVLIFSF